MFQSYKHITSYILLFIIGISSALGQAPSIIENEESKRLAQKAVKSVYQWDFAKATEYAKELEQDMPDHPAAPFLKAMILYWENIPFNFESQEYKQHMAFLEEALSRTEVILDADDDNLEAKFFKISIRSVQIRNYDDNGQTMKSVGAAKQIYSLIMDGFDQRDEFIEYYFPVGLYNYYREYYPEAHPVYKPFVFFFKSGDKEKGLQQMDYAVNHAIFTKPEALGYLAHIQYRCEENPQKAFRYMKRINRLYPNNLHYLTTYTEALLLERNFEEAIPFIEKLLASDREFYKMAGLVYQGMLKEKRDGNIDVAAEHYKEAKKIAKNLSHPAANDLKTYLYLGLSRFYEQEGNNYMAKGFYKDARSHDNYDYVKNSGYKPNE